VNAPEVIETSRLRCRRPRRTDVDAIFSRYASDPAVTKYLGWPRHHSTKDTESFIEFSDGEWRRWAAGPYLVCSRDDGTLLGGSGLAFETPYRASTGYVFAQDAWGQGYATEVLSAMKTLAQALGVRRLYALCHPDHHASSHVLDKGGFVREGVLRAYAEFPNLRPGEAGDVLCYAVVL
jgi:ribosomal-protein-alanine N-acetyltransferase